MLGSAEPIAHARGSGLAGARPRGPSGLTAVPPGPQASPGTCASTTWTSVRARPARMAPSAWTGPTPTAACARRVRPNRRRAGGGFRPLTAWGLGPGPRSGARGRLSFDPGTGEGPWMKMNSVPPAGARVRWAWWQSRGRGRSCPGAAAPSPRPLPRRLHGDPLRGGHQRVRPRPLPLRVLQGRRRHLHLPVSAGLHRPPLRDQHQRVPQPALPPRGHLPGP